MSRCCMDCENCIEDSDKLILGRWYCTVINQYVSPAGSCNRFRGSETKESVGYGYGSSSRPSSQSTSRYSSTRSSGASTSNVSGSQSYTSSNAGTKTVEKSPHPFRDFLISFIDQIIFAGMLIGMIFAMSYVNNGYFVLGFLLGIDVAIPAIYVLILRFVHKLTLAEFSPKQFFVQTILLTVLSLAIVIIVHVSVFSRELGPNFFRFAIEGYVISCVCYVFALLLYGTNHNY